MPNKIGFLSRIKSISFFAAVGKGLEAVRNRLLVMSIQVWNQAGQYQLHPLDPKSGRFYRASNIYND